MVEVNNLFEVGQEGYFFKNSDGQLFSKGRIKSVDIGISIIKEDNKTETVTTINYTFENYFHSWGKKKSDRSYHSVPEHLIFESREALLESLEFDMDFADDAFDIREKNPREYDKMNQHETWDTVVGSSSRSYSSITAYSSSVSSSSSSSGSTVSSSESSNWTPLRKKKVA